MAVYDFDLEKVPDDVYQVLPPLSCVIVTFVVRVGDKYVSDVKEVFCGVVSKEGGFDAFNYFGDAWAVIQGMFVVFLDIDVVVYFTIVAVGGVRLVVMMQFGVEMGLS